MSNITTEEPTVTTGVITSIVTAGLTLFVAAGLPVSDELALAITGFVAVVAPLVAAYFARQKVTPTAQVVVQTKDGDYVASNASVYPNGTPLDVARAA